MVKRRIDTHEECLREFSASFRKEVAENLRHWQRVDPAAARARYGAYVLVLRRFTESLESAGIPLVDVGLADYEVPKLPPA